MADNWTTPLDWTNGAVLTEAQLDEQVRDNETALFNALTADASADTAIWHGHKSGTLAARPAAAHAGRLYYATDLGVQFFDTGTRWDVIGVNHRIAEHVFDDFTLANISSFTTLPAGLNWVPATTGSGAVSVNINKGALQFQSGATLNSTVTMVDKILNANYLVSARTPMLYAARAATLNTTQMLSLLGLTEAGGSGGAPNGIYFRRTDVGAAANWLGVCRAAGVETVTTLAFAGDANYHWFEAVIESTSSVKFYIDGTQLTPTITANIPTTAQRLGFYLQNTEAVSKTFVLDAVEMIAKR